MFIIHRWFQFFGSVHTRYLGDHVMKIRTVLVSTYKKDGLVEFVRALDQLIHPQILSTGGTAKVLRTAGIEITDVSEYTGAPELFGGRIKTLHPKIEGGILYRRDKEQDAQEAKDHDIDGIDMVICNLYPFEEAIKNENITMEDALEMIDIGGPTMIRAAAKNYKDVVVVSQPSQYDMILSTLEEHDGAIPLHMRLSLAIAVFRNVAAYNIAIVDFLEHRAGNFEKFPALLVKAFEKVHPCRYGENWDQEAAFYMDKASPFGIHSLEKLWGKEISFNNYLDIDACFQLLSDLNKHEHVCAIFKHTTPNGVAVDGNSQLEACKNAFSCDPLSAFGGIWGFNKPVEPEVAKYIIEEKNIFIEVLLAPSIPKESRKVLEKKQNMRVLEFGNMLAKREVLYQNLEIRGILGGILLQDYDHAGIVKDWDEKTTRKTSTKERETLVFAMTVCKWAKSNSAVFAKVTEHGMYTIGIGAGQQSRVHVVKLAHSKALEFKHDPTGSVMATDSFFPFPDGVEAAVDAGAKAVLCPGGSIRDGEVIARAEELGISLVFTGKRVFRH
ncbi:bifunctional phosphoribosylaminoimidazolecarboxamide formyltransferase/IMP cyclohydrolase [Candidatus Bathyarchaeota archaeon]|nr:bifunctional phosphoribosylaminoimidazolecarboxamide formyltransferase/IMP cyclohydrolase [Candidatus Bathyarchaeota archaeon]